MLESVARVTKERKGFGDWGLAEEGKNGNGFESCREDDDGIIVAIF